MDEGSDTTKIVKKDCPDPSRVCSYDKEGLKRWVENKISNTQKSEMSLWLKIGGALLPFVVGGLLWFVNIDKRVTKMEYQQSEITQIKHDVKLMAREMVKLRIEIEKIKNKLDKGNT